MLPIQITMRDMPADSSVIESHILKKCEKLSRFCDKVSSCRVVVEFAQKNKHQGKLYNVRIDVTVPGKEFVVTHKHNEDIYVSIRDAFNAAFRQLEQHSRKRHGHVKRHCDVLHGRIARLVQAEGYGFIEDAEGNEYYFSVTNVSYPTFKQLLIGDSVEYQAEMFSDGKQAHHVVLEHHADHREVA